MNESERSRPKCRSYLKTGQGRVAELIGDILDQFSPARLFKAQRQAANRTDKRFGFGTAQINSDLSRQTAKATELWLRIQDSESE